MPEQYEGKILYKVEIGRWKTGTDTWDIVYAVIERVTDSKAR